MFATGRGIDDAVLPAGVIRIGCDHLQDEKTAAAFAQAIQEASVLDVLVNLAWGG